VSIVLSKALTPADAARFLEAARGDRFGLLFELLLVTGARPSEALAWTWADLDTEYATISTVRSLVRTQDGWELADTKTSRSRRSVPLPTSIMRRLQEHRAGQAKERLTAGPLYAGHGLLFATATGEPIDLHNLRQRQFRRVLKRAGLPCTLRLYDLRHSCATLLLAAGEHPKVVSERLGHASTAMTLDVYSHVVPSMQRAATDKLEAILSGGV
jgi:integrase